MTEKSLGLIELSSVAAGFLDEGWLGFGWGHGRFLSFPQISAWQRKNSRTAAGFIPVNILLQDENR